MTKKEMMVGTIEYMKMRMEELMREWERLDRLSKKRELTKREEEKMAAVTEEYQICGHVLKDTQLYYGIKFPAEPMSDEEAHAQVTLEMEQGRDISLVEWAERNGIDPGTARQKALRGALKTAHKVGRNWLINEYEKNTDRRRKK